MNKIQKTILTAVFAISVIGFLPASSVLAVTNLTVNFENTPLFSEANFLPGQAVTKYVDVTNNTSETKTIGVKAKNYTACSENCLADQLKIKITDGDNTLYGETSLTDFFAAGEKKLSDLASGSATKYYFTITFIPEAGNQYQNNEVGFDFDIGIFGQETIGGGGDTGGGGGSGGGGGGGAGGNNYFGGETSLVIYNEAAEPVVSNQADITWQTNHIATSRVIYSAETEAHTFQLDNPPNYGYAHSTVEDTTKTTNHTMNISGLVPGVTYYYRVVSHGSFAVSTEHSFTVPLVKGEQTIKENVYTEGGVGGEVVALNQGIATVEEENTTQETQTNKKPINNFLASLADLFKFDGLNFCLILFIFVVAVIILLLKALFEKQKEEGNKLKVQISFFAAIAGLIVLYGLICPYYKALIVVTGILIALFILISYSRKK